MMYENLQYKHITDLSILYQDAFNAPPWNDQWTLESASKRLMQMLKCDGFYGLVSYKNNKIVGMILGNHEYFYDGVHFNIKEFCVDINLRGNGFGSALLNEFLIRLRNNGIDEAILFTSRTNGTEDFYNKHGFKSFNTMVMMGRKLK